MVPCGDMFDHHTDFNAYYEWVESKECVEFSAFKDIAAGEKLHLTYGQAKSSL